MHIGGAMEAVHAGQVIYIPTGVTLYIEDTGVGFLTFPAIVDPMWAEADGGWVALTAHGRGIIVRLIPCMGQPHTMRWGDAGAGWGGHPGSILSVIFLCLCFMCILPGVCSAVPTGANVSAENLTATFFYSEHCIACTKVLPVVDDLEAKYPSITFVRYIVRDGTDNESLFFSFGWAYDNPYPRYPTVFLSDGSFFEGYGAISTGLPEHLVSSAVGSTEVGGPVPVVSVDPAPTLILVPTRVPVVSSLSLPPVELVIAAGLIDGINPCAVAVLIFLLLTLAGAGGKVQMLRFGAAYVVGIYLMYFISGFGILSVVCVTGFSFYFSCVAGIVAIVLGGIMLVDSFRAPETGHFHISPALLGVVRNIAARGGVMSAFLAGVVVSLIELPCTGGVYLAILAMLSGAEVCAAAGLLALYNLMFVLPLVLIIIAAAEGFSPERMAVMRLNVRQSLRRAGGCALILLGVAVLIWFVV